MDRLLFVPGEPRRYAACCQLLGRFNSQQRRDSLRLAICTWPSSLSQDVAPLVAQLIRSKDWLACCPQVVLIESDAVTRLGGRNTPGWHNKKMNRSPFRRGDWPSADSNLSQFPVILNVIRLNYDNKHGWPNVESRCFGIAHGNRTRPFAIYMQ